MIKTIQKGEYTLIETKDQVKILTLDGKKSFAWINAQGIGGLLVVSHTSHKADQILAIGKYRMYEVKDEPHITDLIHLELMVGEGKWQGYLLLTGLPSGAKKRNRIVSTHELITQVTA